MRTTNPIFPIGIWRRIPHTPFWCSPAITPGTRSGWATQRHPRCGMTTMCARTGEAHIKLSRVLVHRPACRAPPTRTSCEVNGMSGHFLRAEGLFKSKCHSSRRPQNCAGDEGDRGPILRKRFSLYYTKMKNVYQHFLFSSKKKSKYLQQDTFSS